MIKEENGEVQIEGDATEIFADFTVIVKALRSTFAENGFDSDYVEKGINHAIELSKLSSEQLNEEFD